MKRGIVGAGAAIGLALIMFASGSLAPFRADGTGDRRRVAAVEAGALTVAAGDARLDRSIAALQRTLRKSPDDAGSLAALGLSYLTKGRLTADPTYYPKAGAVLRRSLLVDRSGNFRARLGLAVLAAARHDFTRALAWSRAAKRINPFNADIRGVMGDALVELGRYGAAARTLQQMVNLRPDLASYARISYLRELHGDVRGAIRAMSTARDFAGGTGPDAAWASYQLGELYLNSGWPARAGREYRRGMYLAPGYPLPEAGVAKVEAARGDFAAAAATLSEVVKRYPTPELVILLGDLYRAAGNTDQASRQYQLVRAIQGLYRANGVNNDLEVALFDADHGIAPNAAVARARAEYRRRHSIHVADALAWTLYADRRYRPAWRHAHEALRLGTRNALFHFHAGMIAAALHHRSVARRHLATALDINPHFSFLHADEARRTLRRLRA
jgi:tetratricopeptide (TPR) repeat protein